MAEVRVSKAYEDRALRLMGRLAANCTSDTGQGSFTSAVYDAAWLAMIIKQTEEGETWLFPECFEYVIQSQRTDGQCQLHGSQVDGILNTAAALLAMYHHVSKRDVHGCRQTDLLASTSKAEAVLCSLLESWDVGSALHVGFEILVPKLLQLLEDFGFTPAFPGRMLLTRMYEKKMSRFRPEMLYTGHQTTILHSLEALIGQIDFDKIKCHVDNSHGVFGSPASTAAYLMQSSGWDVDAEDYLQKVVRRYGSTGAVPSAYPTPIFELSWTICILDGSGLISADAQQSMAALALKGYLSAIMKDQGGLAGFSRGILPDADDTAKCAAALQCLGETVDLSPMVATFETETHYKTYDQERNPSLSANCNVLLALASSPYVQEFVPQVEKATRFLLDTWDKGVITDKWNLSPAYSHMSLGCALIAVLEKVDQGCLQTLDKTLVMERIPMALCQLLSHVLSDAFRSNAWSPRCLEISAYNVILLGKLLSLPWPSRVRDSALAAFQAGREYIMANEKMWCEPNYLWIEKVTYGSPVLSEAYCLAAAASDCVDAAWSDRLTKRFSIDSARGAVSLISSLSLFQGITPNMLHLAHLEASCFAQRLGRVRLEVFADRDSTMSEDRYLSFIPLAWTSCRLLSNGALSNETLWEMVKISLLNYQVDEFMESVVARLSTNGARILLRTLKSACNLDSHARVACDGNEGNEDMSPPPKRSATHLPPSPPSESEYLSDEHMSRDVQKAYDTLMKFVGYVLQHRAVSSSPASIRAQLSREIFAFLKAHVDHNEANRNLKSKAQDLRGNRQKDSQPSDSRSSFDVIGGSDKSERLSYFEWVRHTGADDTSCPYSFTFFCCLLSEPGSHCLSTASQLYYGQSLCRSLATMCRQYNDYGSWLRDQEEGNLNSLHFPGFTDDGAKRCLMEIAEFERSCVNLAFDRLKTKIPPGLIDAIATFVNVTDFFGQVYVANDLASRIK